MQAFCKATVVVFSLFLACGFSADANNTVPAPAAAAVEQNEMSKDVEPDLLVKLVEIMADAERVEKGDTKLYNRQSRGDNALSDMAFGVFKELVSSFLTSTIGSFFGVETERTSSDGDDFNIITMVMDAVRKNSLQKRMGCPP